MNFYVRAMEFFEKNKNTIYRCEVVIKTQYIVFVRFEGNQTKESI